MKRRPRTRREIRAEKERERRREELARRDWIWNAAIAAALREINALDGEGHDVAESAEAHSHQGAYLNAVVDAGEAVAALRRRRS